MTKSVTSERIDKSSTRNKVLALRANPAIKTNTQIAKVLGIARQTVTKHVNDAKKDLAAAQKALGEYDRGLGEHMPIARRVLMYKELAEQITHPAVALNTLIRIDDLTGITTEKDRLRAINLGEGQQRQGPMFMMAPGSTVQVLNQRVPAHDNPVTQEQQVIEDKTVK